MIGRGLSAFDSAKPGADPCVDLTAPANPFHPLNAGRVAWWLALPGQDGGPKFYDALGRSHGTTIPASRPAWGGTTRPGGWSDLAFDGATTWVDLTGFPPPSALQFASPVLSMAIWAKGTTSVGSTQFLFGDWVAGGSNNYAFFWNNSNQLQWLAGGTAAGIATPTDALWHRIVGTCDGVTLRLYVDGVQKATNTPPGTPQNTNRNWGLGAAFTSSAWYFQGNADDASVWNRALSAREVADDYDLSRGGYPGVLNRLGPPLASSSASSTSPARFLYHRRRRAG